MYITDAFSTIKHPFVSTGPSICIVRNALAFLRFGASPVDATGRFGAVSTTERALIQQEGPTTVSTTVLAADIPAKPPPTTITWLAGNTAAMVVFGCELQVGAQRGMVVSQLLEPEQVDVKRGCVPGTGTGIFWEASNAQ